MAILQHNLGISKVQIRPISFSLLNSRFHKLINMNGFWLALSSTIYTAHQSVDHVLALIQHQEMPMFSKTYTRARYVHHLYVLVCTLKL